jgi:hypothetical protein
VEAITAVGTLAGGIIVEILDKLPKSGFNVGSVDETHVIDCFLALFFFTTTTGASTIGASTTNGASTTGTSTTGTGVFLRPLFFFSCSCVSITFTVATGEAATGEAATGEAAAAADVFMALDDVRPFFIKKWVVLWVVCILFTIDYLCETF